MSLPVERMRSSFNAMVRGELPELPYLGFVAAKVLTDHGDHTLDLQPLDGSLPPMTQVPYEVPFAGARTIVEPGALVLVGFEGGDMTRPHALAFRYGAALQYTEFDCGPGKVVMDSQAQVVSLTCGPCLIKLDAVAGQITITAPIITMTPTNRMQAGPGSWGLSVDASTGAVTLTGTTVDINP